MENIPRKLEKSVAATAAPQAPKRSNRWTILLVADSGKIISIPWIKPLGVVFTFVFLMAAGASIVLYFFFQQEVRINADLRDQLNGVHMEAAELRNEKEMLLARAVMAESRYQASLPAVETGEEDVVPDRVEMPQGAEATSLLPVEKKAEDAAGELSLIGVGEPSLSYDSTKKRVHVQIKIANQGIESQPVSGSVLQLLKGLPNTTWANTFRLPDLS
jgi:hypothetical protein